MDTWVKFVKNNIDDVKINILIGNLFAFKAFSLNFCIILYFLKKTLCCIFSIPYSLIIYYVLIFDLKNFFFF